MFFEGWAILGRTVLFGVVGYVALVTLLRISGKRTLSTMDPFDFVVTTALGSTLATTLLSREVALTTGLLAFGVLIGLQFAVTFLSMRTRRVRRLIKAEPALLFYRGEFLRDAMRREHVPEVEILAAVRESGRASLEEVEAVVLEADSGFSVVGRAEGRSNSALADVGRRRGREAERRSEV